MSIPDYLTKALAKNEPLDILAQLPGLLSGKEGKMLEGDGKRYPFDDAYIDMACDGLREQAEHMINEAKKAGVTDPMPPLQAVFLGTKDAKGRTIGILLPQTLISGLEIDKGRIVRAVGEGIRKVEGRIMVIMVDEAWTYISDAKDDPFVERIKKGERIGEIDFADAKGKKTEALVLNVMGMRDGKAFQYLMNCPVTRNPDGTTAITKGDLIDCSKAEVEGRMVLKVPKDKDAPKES